MPSNREQGWYWVKCWTDQKVAFWAAGHWTGNEWLFAGSSAVIDAVIDIGSSVASQEMASNREPGWYWCKRWWPSGNNDFNGSVEWEAGNWTGDEWLFLDVGNDIVGGQPPIIDFGSAIAPPSSEQIPSQTYEADSLWWLKTKAQPDTWQLGQSWTDSFVLGGGNSVDCGDLYMVGPDALQQPND